MKIHATTKIHQFVNNIAAVVLVKKNKSVKLLDTQKIVDFSKCN